LLDSNGLFRGPDPLSTPGHVPAALARLFWGVQLSFELVVQQFWPVVQLSFELVVQQLWPVV